MPKRSTAKRIDYSKFEAITTSSESDDDFEIPATISKKQKLTTDNTTGKATTKSSGGTQSNSGTKRKERKTRNSRASNAGYDDEIQAALLMSVDEIKQTEGDIITVEDSDEEKVMKIIQGQSQTTQESTQSNVESDAIPDTVPIIGRCHGYSTDAKSTKTSSSDDSPVKSKAKVKSSKLEKSIPDITLHAVNKCKTETTKENQENLKQNSGVVPNIGNRESLQMERVENINRIKSAPVSAKSSPIIPKESSSSLSTSSYLNSSSKFCILTPGRLRLGLSRNTRVSKPLHQNTNFKMS